MYEEMNNENKNYNWENDYNTNQPQKEEKKNGGFFRKIMIAACCGLCFGLFAGVGLFAVDQVKEFGLAAKEQVFQTNGNNNTVISSVSEKEQKEEQDTEEKEEIKQASANQVSVITTDYSEVVERVMPAMVSILNTYTEEMSYWGQKYTQEAQAGGSGIIIAQNDTELLIATNNHVVEGADKLEVTFIDGTIAEAQVKGKDADMDLAVIAILLENLSEETKLAIAIAEMGDSDALKLGEPVIAIGNALGYGQSVTGGFVSALNREIELEDGSTGVFIQTDAAINHGNSGGALLNINGEVVGINSNKISGTSIEGMGYAIPITAAEPIIGDLMTKETKHKVPDGKVGYIGVMGPLTVSRDNLYNLPQGVFIRSVAEDSPAEAAGILSGDIIVDFDGEKITTYEDLEEVLQYYGPGSEAVITVKRQQNGEYVDVEIPIVLGVRPENE